MMMADLLFLLGIAMLMIHELDAIQQQEWRFFLSWTGMDDQRAYQLFTAAHLPLFVLIMAHVTTPGVQFALDLFLIVHALVHTLLRHHLHIRFNNGFSRLWIYGGAGIGFVHLLVNSLSLVSA